MKWQKQSVSILLVVIMTLLVSSSVLAITAKIGNGRVVLYPELDSFGKTTIDRTIKVINDNDVVVNVTLVPAEDIKDIIKIIDKNVILQPGTEKDMRFQIVLSKEGKYEGNINVLFNELNETSQTKQGVALAAKLIIYASEKGSGGSIDTSPDDTDSDSDSIDSNNTGGTLSNVSEKFSPIVIILSITTIVAVIILLYLLRLSKKKKDTMMGNIIGVESEVKSTKSTKSKRKPGNEI